MFCNTRCDVFQQKGRQIKIAYAELNIKSLDILV